MSNSSYVSLVRQSFWPGPWSLVRSVFLFWMLPLVFTTQLFGQEMATKEDDFLRDMYQKGMHDVLRWHCEKQIDSPSTPPGRKSELAAMLIRVGFTGLTRAETEDLAEERKKLQKEADRLVLKVGNHPRSILVKFQQTLIGIEYAKILSLQVQQDPSNQKLRQETLSHLADSQNSLNSLSTTLVKLKSDAPPKYDRKVSYGKLTRSQITALQNVLVFQRLRALEFSYAMIPNQDQRSKDSIAKELNQQAKQLRSQAASSSKTWWDAVAAVLKSTLWQKDWAGFDSQWKDLSLESSPKRSFGKLAALKIEKSLKRRELAEAAKSLVTIRELATKRFPGEIRAFDDWLSIERCSPWPEIDIVRCRVAMELALGQKEVSGSLVDKVVGFGSRVAARHGVYWGQRLNNYLVSSGDKNSHIVPVLLIRQAIRNKDLATVKSLATEQIRTAINRKDSKTALSVASVIAGSVRRLPSEKWMMDNISMAASTFPEKDESGPVHAYACVVAETLLREKKIGMEDFLEVCKRQLIHWPSLVATNTIRVPLGGRLIQAGRYIDAIEILRDIPLSSPQLGQAVSFSEIAWDRFFSRRPKDKEGAKKWRQAASRMSSQWKSKILTKDKFWVTPWTPGSKRIALLAMDSSLMSSGRVQGWLTELASKVKRKAAVEDNDFNSRLQVVMIYLDYRSSHGAFQSPVVLDKSIKSKDLVYLINRLVNDVPPVGLKGRNLNAAEKAKKLTAAKLIVRCTEILPSELQNSGWFLGLRCRCHISTSNIKQAQKDAATIVSKAGNSLYARQLEALAFSLSNDPDDAAKAKKSWRWISKRTKPKSPSWYEAKYYVAKAHVASGQKDKAASVLQYLKFTDKKNWDLNPYKVEFEKLLASLEGK